MRLDKLIIARRCFLIVFALMCVNLISSCKDEGELAKPVINSNPTDAVKVNISPVRLPDGVDGGRINYQMKAVYASLELSCSVIKYGQGGSVVNPQLEVNVERGDNGEFIAYRDLVKSDKCNWKLMHLDVIALLGGESEFSFSVSPAVGYEREVEYACQFGKKGSVERLSDGVTIRNSGGICLYANSVAVKNNRDFNSIIFVYKDE